MVATLMIFAFSERAQGFLPPLDIDVVWIYFDYEDGYANDALQIVKNASTEIAKPEWYPAYSRNNRFAYIKGQTNRKIKVRFWHNQGEGAINNMHVRTTGSGYYPGTIAESIVYFTSGSFGEAILTMTNGQVSNYVQLWGFYYYWYVTKLNGQPLDPQYYSGMTGGHDYYILLAAPQAPMSVPWTDVLDYACVWARNQSTESSAVTKITQNAYTSLGKTYNGYDTHAPVPYFNLTKFLAESWADCRDMSAVVQVFTRAIGVGTTQVRRINGQFLFKPILPIGYTQWITGTWNFHQVGWYSNVYDACVKLNQSNPRIPVNENINGEYKNDLYNYGYWTPQTPTTYTTVY